MYYIYALRVFKNFSVFHSISRLKDPFKSVVNQPKIFFSGARFPIDTISKLNKDILLYTFERSKFYKYLSLFGVVNFAVWSFYAGEIYMNMKDKSSEDFMKYNFFAKSPLWQRAIGGSNALLHAIILCIALGLLSTAVCTILPSRIVKELILCKGGRSAILVTYGPFGNTLKREIPLRNLSCVTSRSETKSYLALKVKPKWFYYLVDVRGNFHDPKLFDYTIGTRTSRAY